MLAHNISQVRNITLCTSFFQHFILCQYGIWEQFPWTASSSIDCNNKKFNGVLFQRRSPSCCKWNHHLMAKWFLFSQMHFIVSNVIYIKQAVLSIYSIWRLFLYPIWTFFFMFWSFVYSYITLIFRTLPKNIFCWITTMFTSYLINFFLLFKLWSMAECLVHWFGFFPFFLIVMETNKWNNRSWLRRIIWHVIDRRSLQNTWRIYRILYSL